MPDRLAHAKRVKFNMSSPLEFSAALRLSLGKHNAYARTVGRMKAQPAFDGFALETGENQLFGDATTDKRHFTAFSARHSQVANAKQANARTVRAMDAMQQISDVRSTVAAHWRIRHGTMDRDTSLAVPALLAAAAQQRGAQVDLALPWGRQHSGDYDLGELFTWALNPPRK